MENDKQFNEVPITTDIPMLRDRTIYRLYIKKEEKNDINEIKAISKICNINYIEARKKLLEQIVFVAEGDAYEMKDLLQIIGRYEVSYEIKPQYPY